MKGWVIKFDPTAPKPWTARQRAKTMRAQSPTELVTLLHSVAAWPAEAREALEVVENWIERNAIAQADPRTQHISGTADVQRLVRRVLDRYPEAL